MADNSRIDDLRRRVEKDPASIAFAQLAEECRRAGQYQEAVDTCRAGLEIHPGYLSARVTLGRALVELGLLDEAQTELSRVLESAPENLAAIRGLAEIYHRRGELAPALAQYRAALLLARNDPDLEQTIADLSRQIEPAKPAPSGGLTMQHMQDELLKLAPPPPKPTPVPGAPPTALAPPAPAAPVESLIEADSPQPAEPEADFVAQIPDLDRAVAEFRDQREGVPDGAEFHGPREAEPQVSLEAAPPIDPERQAEDSGREADRVVDGGPQPGAVTAQPPDTFNSTLTAASDDRATRTVAALEQWLAAIHVSREPRHP